MRQALLGLGPHALAAGVGLALGWSLARISSPPEKVRPSVVASAPAPKPAPVLAVQEATGTSRERIALVFSLGNKPQGQARDVSLYRAILALAPEDFLAAASELPTRLVGYGKGQVGRAKARSLVEAWMDRWLTLDAPGALRFLASADFFAKLGAGWDGGPIFPVKDSVQAAALRPLARRAPQWTHDWIAAQPAGPDRDEVVGALLEEVAQRDPAQARKFLASFAEGPNRLAAVRGLVAGLAEGDPRAAFDLAVTEPTEQVRQRLFDTVLRSAARQGLGVARELVQRIDDPNERATAAAAVLNNLSQSSADELLPWIQEESTHVKEWQAYWWHENWMRAVAEKVQGASSGAAAEWAATLANDPQRLLLRRIAGQWAQRDPAALRDWLARSGATLDSAAASALRASFAQMSKSDASSARSWTETLPDGSLRQQALLDVALRSGRAADAGAAYAPLAASDKDGAVAHEVAGILAKKNCEAAAAWVSQLGDEPAQKQACRALIETWSVRDPAAAAAWLEAQPAGAARDAGLCEYAQKVALADPAAAAEWAGYITDRDQRGNAADYIFMNWALEDPVAARAWIEKFPNIEDDHRGGILRSFR
jgi:hypothetical protein